LKDASHHIDKKFFLLTRINKDLFETVVSLEQLRGIYGDFRVEFFYLIIRNDLCVLSQKSKERLFTLILSMSIYFRTGRTAFFRFL